MESRTMELERKNPKIALFALSADPVTNGHVDIVTRALEIVDVVYVATVEHSAKKNAMFSFEDRLEMLRLAFGTEVSTRIVVLSEPIRGMTIDYASDVGADLLLRGVRDYTDLDYEFKLAHLNRMASKKKFGRSVETFFVPADPMLSMFSSSAVRELIRLGDETWKDIVPKAVVDFIEEKER